MATARRVIFSTSVIPTQSVEGEETGIRHTEFQTSPNGTLGGKGTAIINAIQWSDSWTSMERPEQIWEDLDSKWEAAHSLWNVNLSGDATITNTPIGLSTNVYDVAFLYVKNTGTTYNALLSLDELGLAGGGSSNGNYYIIIPPGGSVALRGDGDYCELKEVYLKSEGSSGEITTIEFIIAVE